MQIEPNPMWVWVVHFDFNKKVLHYQAGNNTADDSHIRNEYAIRYYCISERRI